VAAAVLLAVIALLLSYGGHAFLTSRPFADRATATLSDPAVRADLADHLTDAVVGRVEDLTAVRPLVRAVAGVIIGTPAFRALFHRAALGTHAALVQNRGGPIFVTVADASVLVGAALERLAPGAAARIDVEQVARLLTIRPGGAALTAVHAAQRIYGLAWLAALLALLAGAGAIWCATDRRAAVRSLGLALAAGGLLVVTVYVIGGAVAGQVAAPGRAAAVTAVWRAFLGGLRTQALLVAAAGAIVAAAASAWPRLTAAAASPATAGRSAVALLRGRERPGLAASAVLIALGVVVVLEPVAMLTVAVTGAGVYLIYRGVAGVLTAAGERVRRARAPRRPEIALARVVPAAAAAVALAAVIVIVADGGEDGAPAATPDVCNGSAVLCGRPLNHVAFAATHNSMASVTIPHWLFGQQDGTIADQLDGGIRGLLIDTYYGDAVPGGVRTDLRSLPKREAAVREIGAPAVEAAERLRSRLGHQGPGRRGIYLCHGFCELGAVSLASALADLRSFLVANPGAVVITINQDEGVTPADIKRAFADAGLLDLVYHGPLGPFPTLGQLVDSNQRLVVLAENDAGTGIQWYRLAYAHALQETPFRFTRATQLTDAAKLAASCRANRGPGSAPLFLVNNWIDTTPVPRPSNAALVNARAALLRRVEECQSLRHRLPNLVAVDFYRRGDVLGVVDTLNGITPPSGLVP
jgi:hypothetical protein